MTEPEGSCGPKGTLRYLQGTSRHFDQDRQSFLFAAAISNAPPPVPKLSQTQDAVNILLALPDKRKAGVLLSSAELEQVESLLRSFVSSPNPRAAPSKLQLHAAVSSLLHSSSAKLSQKWNKTQLSTVLHRWVAEALELDDQSLQPALVLEIRTSKKGKNKLAHEIFVEEDDGSVATFKISSPEKASASSRPPTRTPGAVAPPSEAEIGPLGTPSSVATSATAFMRELSDLAVGADLAAMNQTPTHPGVEDSSHHQRHHENLNEQIPSG